MKLAAASRYAISLSIGQQQVSVQELCGVLRALWSEVGGVGGLRSEVCNLVWLNLVLALVCCANLGLLG